MRLTINNRTPENIPTRSESDTVWRPEEPGTYKDSNGDILRVFLNDQGEPHCTYITIDEMLVRPVLAKKAYPVADLSSRFAPFTRITTVEQLREALNVGEES